MPDQRGPRRGALAGAVSLLAAQNVVVNELAPDAAFVPLNLAGTALLAGLARTDHLGLADLGLERRHVSAGLRLGGGLALVAAGGIVVGAALPLTRGFFEDERIADLSTAGAVFQTLIRVPLGTVVLEEFAFRGALPAMFARRTSKARAVAAAGGLFGLWHVLPTLSALEANAPASSLPEKVGLVTGSVVATGVVGAFLYWLRARSRSLLAPAVLHAATNSVATAAAFVVLRGR